MAWILVFIGITTVIYAYIWYEGLQRDYGLNAPTALFIGGGLAITIGILSVKYGNSVKSIGLTTLTDLISRLLF